MGVSNLNWRTVSDVLLCTLELSDARPHALIVNGDSFLPWAYLHFSTYKIQARNEEDQGKFELVIGLIDTVNNFRKTTFQEMDAFDISLDNGDAFSAARGGFKKLSAPFGPNPIRIETILFPTIVGTNFLPKVSVSERRHPVLEACLEDLMKAAWHPRRFLNWCMDVDEQREFYADFRNTWCNTQKLHSVKLILKPRW